MLQRKGNDFIFIDILLFEDPMKFTVKVSVEFRGWKFPIRNKDPCDLCTWVVIPGMYVKNFFEILEFLSSDSWSLLYS